MNDQARVLVIDDDPEIRDLLSEFLSEEGFAVSAVADGKAMRKIIDRVLVDVVILDLKLGREDGFSLASELRQGTNPGIIILSEKGDVIDRVAGLEVGADDYVSKPFHLRELLARVRSVLRRRNESVKSEDLLDNGNHGREMLQFAGWRLDLRGRKLTSPSNAPVELTSGEFDLLHTLLQHPKHVLSRDQLLDMARNREAALFDRSVDVQIGRLRRKIEADPRRPALIKTVRGAGYMFAADVHRR